MVIHASVGFFPFSTNLRFIILDFGDILAERDEEIKRLQAELARAHEENTRLQKSAGGTATLQTQKDNQISVQYGGALLCNCFH